MVKNDTFIALWIHDNPSIGRYPIIVLNNSFKPLRSKRPITLCTPDVLELKINFKENNE
jgi:hypothetical protein